MRLDQLWKVWFGASPDVIVVYDCCGKGIVEVKCPFCYTEELPDEDATNFCMTKDSSGIYMYYTIIVSHAYFSLI